MMYYTLEELKAKIVAGMDAYQLLDILDISFFELVEKFSDEIEDAYEEIVSALGEEPFL